MVHHAAASLRQPGASGVPPHSTVRPSCPTAGRSCGWGRSARRARLEANDRGGDREFRPHRQSDGLCAREFWSKRLSSPRGFTNGMDSVLGRRVMLLAYAHLQA